jgi:hypothetical protein
LAAGLEVVLVVVFVAGDIGRSSSEIFGRAGITSLANLGNRASRIARLYTPQATSTAAFLTSSSRILS